MFCNKCGQKLATKAKVCSNCGAPSKRAEYCGGFWGLVGEKPPVAPAPVSRRETAAPVQTGRAASVKKRKRPVIWYVICSVLLVLCLLQTFKACRFSNEADEYRALYEEEKEKNERAEEDETDQESNDRAQNGEAVREKITENTNPGKDTEENVENNPDETRSQEMQNPSTDADVTETEASEDGDTNSSDLGGDPSEENENGPDSTDGEETETENNDG